MLKTFWIILCCSGIRVEFDTAILIFLSWFHMFLWITWFTSKFCVFTYAIKNTWWIENLVLLEFFGSFYYFWFFLIRIFFKILQKEFFFLPISWSHCGIQMLLARRRRFNVQLNFGLIAVSNLLFRIWFELFHFYYQLYYFLNNIVIWGDFRSINCTYLKSK